MQKCQQPEKALRSKTTIIAVTYGVRLRSYDKNVMIGVSVLRVKPGTLCAIA